MERDQRIHGRRRSIWEGKQQPWRERDCLQGAVEARRGAGIGDRDAELLKDRFE
jgi:hypothetical protein